MFSSFKFKFVFGFLLRLAITTASGKKFETTFKQ